MSQKDNNEVPKLFGAHMKKLRTEKGLSLRGLAINCNLDDSNISKIEQGKFDIRLSTLFEIAKGLEVEPKDLLDFENKL